MKTILADLDAKKSELEAILTEFHAKVSGVEDIIDAAITDTQFREIAKDILSVKDDTCVLRKTKYTKIQKLESIKRFTETMASTDKVDDIDPVTGESQEPTMFVPPLVKGQMIFVKFAGIGSELDRGHFAIVWDEVSPKQDSIVIIPTKSEKPHYKEYDHSFSIGKVGFLSKETWVQVRNITTISRKRIELTQFQLDASTPGAEVFISDDQEKWLEDAMRVTWGKQTTLLEKILNNGKNMIPEFPNFSTQSTHLNRPTRYFKNDWDAKKTYYSLFDDSVLYEIKWHSPRGQLSRGSRNSKIRDWAYASPSTGKTRYDTKLTMYADLQNLR